MGRPRKLTAEQQAVIWNTYISGTTNIASIAKQLGLPYQVVYACIKREQKDNEPTNQTAS